MWIKQGSYYGEKINVQEQMRISDKIFIALYYVFIVNGLLKQNYLIKKCPYRPKLITDFAILPQKRPNYLHELELYYIDITGGKVKTNSKKETLRPTNPSLHLKPYLSLMLCDGCLSRGVSEIFWPPDCKVSSRNTHLTVSEGTTQALLIEECCVTPSSIVKNKALNILFGGLTVLLLKEFFKEQIFLVPQKYVRRGNLEAFPLHKKESSRRVTKYSWCPNKRNLTLSLGLGLTLSSDHDGQKNSKNASTNVIKTPPPHREHDFSNYIPEFPPRCEHPLIGLSTTKLSFSNSSLRATWHHFFINHLVELKPEVKAILKVIFFDPFSYFNKTLIELKKKKHFRIGGYLPIKRIVLLSLSKTVCILTASKWNRKQTTLVCGISDESLKANSLYLSLYFEEADFIQKSSMVVFVSIRDNNYKALNLERQGNC
ncbi:hypothetical protein EGR_03042 [Echinococcus granulosus]|uniref:Uncharacterized protein n=1 Tax=Echinococcus granulosus TaxID=6210 RepID=W6ULM0_ECHGR|nr:hypothetical protein EGR_03042 [Echinococcus granulosus]EUB62021.1 hypothetical protein EGR_03042 [Echinococcus granulosus]